MSRVLIVTPALNEADVLPEFLDEVLRLRTTLAPMHEVRLLVVDDGSTDSTLTVLRDAAVRHGETVSYLSFAANAGHQAALIAGLSHAGSWPEVIITMDADLEHPVAKVPQLIDTWQRTGAIVVHTVRKPARELSWLKRAPSAIFYRVTAALTGLELTAGQADFRLWDAATVRGLNQYLLHIGSLRVFAAWLPGRKASVEYDQHVRPDRHSRFTFRKNYELAAISIIRFSNIPLRAITVLGGLGLLFSAVYGAVVVAAASRGRTVPGWSSTIFTVLIFGCLQLLSIGVLASYLRRLVFSRDLPPFIIRESRLPEPSDPA